MSRKPIHYSLSLCEYKNFDYYRKSRHTKSPQVSTYEYVLHSGNYAAGLKFLGKDKVHLDPEHDELGKPKHLYWGKLYTLLYKNL